MSHQVVWTKSVTDFVIDNAGLTDFEKSVLITRISGMSQIQQAMYHSVGIGTIKRTTERLKYKYDVLQKEYPDTLKPRKNSIYERELDAD